MCVAEGLFPDDDFVLKVVQMEELLQIRHSVFAMGPAGAGKTQCWSILAKAQEQFDGELKYNGKVCCSAVCRPSYLFLLSNCSPSNCLP